MGNTGRLLIPAQTVCTLPVSLIETVSSELLHKLRAREFTFSCLSTWWVSEKGKAQTAKGSDVIYTVNMIKKT